MVVRQALNLVFPGAKECDFVAPTEAVCRHWGEGGVSVQVARGRAPALDCTATVVDQTEATDFFLVFLSFFPAEEGGLQLSCSCLYLKRGYIHWTP